MPTSLGYVIVYVPDVASALDFYSSAFGLTRRFLTPEGDYGELETGSTTLSFVSHPLAESNLEGAGGFVPLDPRGRPVGVSITLVTDDVDACLAAAVEHGGRAYVAPIRKPWGQTVAYVIDPFGVLIEIATAVD